MHGQGFLTEGIESQCFSSFGIDDMAKSGTQDNLDIGANRSEMLRQLRAHHVWHRLIGDHQIETMRIGLKRREGV